MKRKFCTLSYPRFVLVRRVSITTPWFYFLSLRPHCSFTIFQVSFDTDFHICAIIPWRHGFEVHFNKKSSRSEDSATYIRRPYETLHHTAKYHIILVHLVLVLILSLTVRFQLWILTRRFLIWQHKFRLYELNSY